MCPGDAATRRGVFTLHGPFARIALHNEKAKVPRVPDRCMLRAPEGCDFDFLALVALPTSAIRTGPSRMANGSRQKATLHQAPAFDAWPPGPRGPRSGAGTFDSLTLQGTTKHNRLSLSTELESDPVQEVDKTDPTGETP